MQYELIWVPWPWTLVGILNVILYISKEKHRAFCWLNVANYLSILHGTNYIYIYLFIYFLFIYLYIYIYICRSQWTRGLRRRSSAARLLRLWVRISPGAWKFLCCECCVLSGTGLCDGLITRPEKSYRLWRVVVCDQETSKTRRLKPATGLWKIQPQR
jgi:hypothetical protein